MRLQMHVRGFEPHIRSPEIELILEAKRDFGLDAITDKTPKIDWETEARH
jgi:hypothetical protein